MPEEPEAELQATANLSPVSPSPVHSVASQVVPVLQDTVDTIDAMVAAAAAAAASAVAVTPDANTKPATSTIPNLDPIVGAGDDDVVDDDSFNDPYGDVDQEVSAPQSQQPHTEQELLDSNDDYAKTFDSPIGPEEGEGEDIQPEDVSSIHRESNQVAPSSDRLTSRASDTLHAVTEPPATSTQLPQSGSSPLSATITEPHTDEQGAQTPLVQAAPSAVNLESNSAGSPTQPTDIQKLVADLTAHAEPNSNDDPSALAIKAGLPAGACASSALPSATSLPPRPPFPQAGSQSYSSQQQISGSIPASVAAPPTPGQPSTYVAAGASALSPDALGTLPVTPLTGLNAHVAISMNPPPYPSQPPTYATDGTQDADYQRQWDLFMADERQYMSEAKWDRFPEGSRIFIGNLSSDKVSKRDVFDLFHRFGRLAQISLKSAYGFVQYHTVEEGERAMQNLEGIEIKGRRIHLEVSRIQDKSKKEKNRSPERDRGRGRDGRDGGRDGARKGERYNHHQNRDDYRPARNHSPRRNDYQRDNAYGRDRGYHDGGRGRGRSRSPGGYGRHDKDSYRRRSPSPYGWPRHDREINLPQRYGADVPDVQIIKTPEVSREFVNWIEQAFTANGLRSEVMILASGYSRDAVTQHQVAEGVHAVVNLDIQAQHQQTMPVTAFIRSRGNSKVDYLTYDNLDPLSASGVILSAKKATSDAAISGQQPYSLSGYPNSYGQQRHHQQPGGTFSVPQYPQQSPVNPANVANLISQIGPMDNATVQGILALLQSNTYGGPTQPESNRAPGGPQVDLQAILSSLGSSATAQQPVPPAVRGAPYGAQAPPNGGAGGNGDAAAQVQNIMAHLARYRQ